MKRFGSRSVRMSISLLRGALFSTLQGACLTGVVIVQGTGVAIAQLQPDQTLGSERSQINSGSVGGQTTDLINGGARRGSSLFHSFSAFNVLEGQRVFFTNPTGVENILSRVTGSDVSNILGTLGVDGGANLFFLNPNGIVFGTNAQLDVRGSFVATTADRFVFSNNVEFGATNPQAPPLLNLSVPVGLQYGTGTGAIASQAQLAVDSGQSLLLAGGEVNLTGTATNRASLTALGGQIGVVAIAPNGSVGLGVEGDRFNLNVPANTTRVDVSFNNTNLNVASENGGNIAVYGRNLNASNSEIQASILASGETSSNPAGDIILDAAESIQMTSSLLINELGEQADGNAGDIRLTANFVDLADSIISTNTGFFSVGDAGNIFISANSFEAVANRRSLIISNTFGNGDAGNIEINVLGELSLSTNGSGFTSIQSGVARAGQGDAGNIAIQADSVVLSNSSIRGDTAGTGGTGRDVSIRARSIELRNGALISASTFGNSPGGNVIIDADSLSLTGIAPVIPFGFLATSSNILALTQGLGDAGNVNITTRNLILRDGAVIASVSFGLESLNAQDLNRVLFGEGYLFGEREELGRGGNITIDADSIEVTGISPRGILRLPSRISTSTSSTSDAGDLTINTRQLRIQAGAIVSTAALGRFDGAGNSGNLTVNASESIDLVGGSGGDAFLFPSALSADTFGPGQAGDLRIRTQRLTAQNGGVVSVSTFGSAQGGDMFVDAEQINLSGAAGTSFPSGFYAQTFDNGQAGNMTIRSTQMSISNGATIAAASDTLENSNIPRGFVNFVRFPINIQPTGAGGTIDISARDLFLSNQGRVRTSSITGVGGNIILRDLEQLQIDNAAITASTQTGRAGNLNINAETIRLNNQGALTAEATAAGTAGNLRAIARQIFLQNGSSFTVSSPTGQAGNLNLSADTIFLDQSSLTARTGLSQERAGANIRLRNVDLLLLRNGSQVSADALANANGGNIFIDGTFIVAVLNEDSDIRANAFEGSGGNIEILTQGLFGIQPAERPIVGISDITASSERGVQGVISIQTPEVDPTRGLTELPANVVDASNQIAQVCSAGGGVAENEENEFVVTGRGGLPPDPAQALNGEEVLADWVTTNAPGDSAATIPSGSRQETSHSPPVTATTTQIVEAQGWLIGTDGKVHIVADNPNIRSNLISPTSTPCS